MKVLISADMEGISGIVDWEEVTPGTSDYAARGRQLMTDDVNAAINGAFTGGADEVVVADGHWNGRNILIERLDPRARLNSGSPSPYSMLQGLDDKPTPEAVICLGYHAMQSTKKAVLDHTWSDTRVRAVYLNDVLVGELGLNAALAGAWGAPVIAVTGDQHAGLEAQELLGSGLEIAVVKNATGRFAAQCLPLPEARERICDACAKAVVRLKEGRAARPYVVAEPVRLAVEFQHTQYADRGFLMPGSERRTGTRLELTLPDMITAHRAFRGLMLMTRD
ncbi:MAG: M55 family metallopeptidase [Anaerolineales bacterium]|nr:M55 family metallopeptidase [Anaerolineales bacterium]